MERVQASVPEENPVVAGELPDHEGRELLRRGFTPEEPARERVDGLALVRPAPEDRPDVPVRRGDVLRHQRSEVLGSD